MKRFSLQKALTYVLPIVIFAVMLTWFVLAISNAGESTSRNELAAVRSTVENGITMCYAIEGAYPEDLEYLVENYGVIYDSQKYIVYYDRFAANIRPTVSVLERQGKN